MTEITIYNNFRKMKMGGGGQMTNNVSKIDKRKDK